MLLPGESVLIKVKCLVGGYHPLDLNFQTRKERNFNGYPHAFGDKESNSTIGNTVRRKRKSEIQYGGLQSGNTYISTCRHDSNYILTAIPHCSKMADASKDMQVVHRTSKEVLLSIT